MAIENKMNIDERYKYLGIKQQQYRAATTRQEQQQLLDQMVAVTGLHRKYLIQLMSRTIRRRVRRREREKTYGPDVDAALALLWQAQHYICPERLTPNLVFTAELLAQHGALQLSPQLKAQLADISISTVRRHLPALPPTHPRRAQKRLQNTLQRQIPAGAIPWDTTEPGHFELDLVFHCGDRSAGQFVYTLQIIDVATGWSGRRAILGRSHLVIADALHYLFTQLPFPVIELHPDNGSEFLNANLLRFFDQFYPHIQFSRSRPRHPNDNRFVEQKNSSLVRAFLGDRRFDTVTQTRYLNHLYTLMDRYYNFIQPVMHQIEKQWVPAADGRAGYLRRKHDTPRPPVNRLCATDILTPTQKQALLTQQYDRNLLLLLQDIETGLAHLFAYPCAQPNESHSVFQTLAAPELFPQACAALGLPAVQTAGNLAVLSPIATTTTTATTTSLATSEKEVDPPVR